MKKIIAAALLLVLVVSMLGCTKPAPATRGTVTDGVYTNDHFGLSFKIPEGWRALTDEEYKAKFIYGLPTNEELAASESEFKDIYIINTADETQNLTISYSMLFDKGATDNNVKNKLALIAKDVVFGIIDPVKIGDNNYSIMSGPVGDTGKVLYYFWSRDMIGNYRPLIWVTLDSAVSIDTIIANFSTFSTAE